MLPARMNDGRFGPPPALYPPAPGIWRPTPPNFANDPAPWVGNVRPFIVPSAEMLRTARAQRAHQSEYARGLQRDQGDWLTHEHDPNSGSRPMLRSSGKTKRWRSGTGSFAR